jgi:hypothetical protein
MRYIKSVCVRTCIIIFNDVLTSTTNLYLFQVLVLRLLGNIMVAPTSGARNHDADQENVLCICNGSCCRLNTLEDILSATDRTTINQT